MLAGGGAGSGGTVVAFPARQADQVGFAREELSRILDLSALVPYQTEEAA